MFNQSINTYGAGQSCMLYPRQGPRHIHHHGGAEGAPVQQGGSALQHHAGGAGRLVLVVKTTSFIVVAKIHRDLGVVYVARTSPYFGVLLWFEKNMDVVESSPDKIFQIHRHTRELISISKMPHKHSNKDLSLLQ